MLKTCPECGENELVWSGYEHYQGDEGGQCVCENCGAVVAVNDLTNDGTSQYEKGQPSTAQERKAYAMRSQAQQISRGRRQGIQFTKQIAQCLECGSAMTSEAVALFERFYCHDMYRRCSMSLKHKLAGCCVYIVCRRRGWPIAMASVASFTDGGAYDLQALKNDLLAHFEDLSDIRPPDLIELVEAQSKRSCFSDFIRDTLTNIIVLCRDTWIAEGRRPEIVIAAATYVAWQSEDPKGRGQISTRKFCPVYHFAYSARIGSIVNEIKSTLCQLAAQMPWVVEGSITNKNVIWHLSDILEYRCSLEADVRANFFQKAQNDQLSGSVSLANTSTTSDGIEPSAVVVSLPDVKCVEDLKSIEPFLPTAFKFPRNPRKRQLVNVETDDHPDLDSVELGNDDIPEKDMCFYVKSAKEVEENDLKYDTE